MGVIPGEPRESPKPQPLGNMTVVILFMACTICGLFLIWRKLSSLRRVVSHQLHSLTSSEGRIRLSEDDGPPASEFIADDSDDDQNEQPNPKISRNIPRQRPGLGGTQTVIPESESA